MIIVLHFGTEQVQSQIPKKISYQGHLYNQDGYPYDGNVTMTFTIHEKGNPNAIVHQEAQSFECVKGLFSTEIGKEKPIVAAFDKPYEIQVQVNAQNGNPYTIELTSSAYAMRSAGVTDTSVYVDDINAKGAANGTGLISLNGKAQWSPVIRNVLTDGIIYVSTLNNDGEIRLIIPQGRIPGDRIMDYSIPISKFDYGDNPKNKQVITYDSVSNTLKLMDPSNGSLALPFESSVGFTKPLFSITNSRNGTAGKFSIQTNPGTQHALIGENNGIGSAIAGFATGNGNAGYYSVQNTLATTAALKVESNSKGNGIESMLSNTLAKNTGAIIGTSVSDADSSSGVIGVMSSKNAGAFSVGVKGINASTTGKGIGVFGTHAGTGVGVAGYAKSGIGVQGISADSIGVFAAHVDSNSNNPAFMALSKSNVDSSTAVIAILDNPRSGANSAAIIGKNNSSNEQGYGIWGQHAGMGAGVLGTSSNGIGLKGVSQLSFGIVGHHNALTGDESGVQGMSASLSSKASGVVGIITATNPGVQSAGIAGKNMSKNVNGFGVYGSHDGAGSGVYGTSASGIGIDGFIPSTAASGIAIRGILESKNGSAIQAQAISTTGLNYGVNASVISDSGIAIKAKASSTKNSSYAGYFEGKLQVTGDITKTYGSGTTAADKRAMPIAYGSIAASGAIYSGTPNFTSYWDSATKQYVISLNNQAYNSSEFVSVVNAASGSVPIFVTTSKFGSDLLSIKCFNLQGEQVQSEFHLVIYKP